MKVLFCLLAISVPVMILACSLPVGADPVPVQGFSFISSPEGIALLFVTNFFVNLLLFMLFLVAILKHEGKRAGKITPNRMRFYTLIILSGVFITLVGSVVDATFLYWTGYQWMQLRYDALNWSAAASLIFISVFFASWAIMRVRPVLSLIPASGMAILNWFLWSYALWGYETEFCLPPLVFIAILTVPLFHLLGRWHRAEFAEKKAE